MARHFFVAVAVVVMAAAGLHAPAAGAQEVDKKTERLWKAKCSSCHGMDGKGDTKKGKELQVESMATAAFQKKYSDDHMRKVILEGLDETRAGRKVQMDPYKEELKPDQVDALIKYIRGLAPAQ